MHQVPFGSIQWTDIGVGTKRYGADLFSSSSKRAVMALISAFRGMWQSCDWLASLIFTNNISWTSFSFCDMAATCSVARARSWDIISSREFFWWVRFWIYCHQFNVFYFFYSCKFIRKGHKINTNCSCDANN